MDTLKSIIKGIIEVLQLLAMIALAFVTLIMVDMAIMAILEACGMNFQLAAPICLPALLMYTAPVLGGALDWRSRKEYWEWWVSQSEDPNKK